MAKTAIVRVFTPKLTVFLNGQIYLGLLARNGDFGSKSTLSHSKLDITAIKSIYFVKKTQLKSTKDVLVSNKMLELWVKLPVSDDGLI